MLYPLSHGRAELPTVPYDTASAAFGRALFSFIRIALLFAARNDVVNRDFGIALIAFFGGRTKGRYNVFLAREREDYG